MSDVVRTTTRVRYAETDQMGVVYHANYVVYFEIGRTDFMRQRGILYSEMEREGVVLAVVDVSARFIKPARYDDLLLIDTRLTRATNVRVQFDYHIYQAQNEDAGEAGPVLCEGRTSLGCVNGEGRPTRFRSPWREKIQAAISQVE